MADLQFATDSNGLPILVFANVANAGVAKLDPNAKSGNDAHDARSGKFAPKPGGPNAPDQQTAPENQNPLEYKRMLDAARDAAREMDLPEEGDIREFLAGRAKDPGNVDVASFLAIVKEQKLSDLVDLIDQQMRTQGVNLKTGRRRVRVVSPKGYVRRAFSALKDEGVAELMHRLEAKGHSEEEVEAFVLGRAKPDRHEVIKTKKAEVAASDEFEPHTWWLAFADEDRIIWDDE